MLFVEETMHLALRIPLHAMPLLGNGNNCSSLMLVSVFFCCHFTQSVDEKELVRKIRKTLYWQRNALQRSSYEFHKLSKCLLCFYVETDRRTNQIPGETSWDTRCSKRSRRSSSVSADLNIGAEFCSFSPVN